MDWAARLRATWSARGNGSRKQRTGSPDGGEFRSGPERDADLERDLQGLGREWLEDSRNAAADVPSVWSDRWMERALADEAFKVQLFRFVDVFPMLGDPGLVCDVLADYFSQPGLSLPRGIQTALRATRLAKRTASRAIGHQIRSMGRNFIAGETIEDAVPGLRAGWESGRAFSVDLLGEACVSTVEAERYAERYVELIERLSSEVATWPGRELLEADPFGALPRANVSIKLSSLDPRAASIDLPRAIDRLVGVLSPILDVAARRGVFVNFDIEQFALKELILATFERCAQRIDFCGGLALQAYLRSAIADAERIIGWARRNDRLVTVRLVKGAYWDYESIHAQQEGWPSPVWPNKATTDACFEELVGRFVRAFPERRGKGGVRLALGSHNVRSIACGLAHLARSSLPLSALELQMLYGMAEPLKSVAVARGLRVREYVPVGELIPGMAYLVRRLLENTSNESWLKAGFLHGAPNEVLLRAPQPRAESFAAAERVKSEPLHPGTPGVAEARPFHSEPLRDLHDPDQFASFESAVRAATLPAPPSHVEDVEGAIATAAAAFDEWRRTPAHVRAACLIEAAARMRAQRDSLAALVVLENGKTWRDADADVCEAIEFCEYYARAAPRLFESRRLGRFWGEVDHQLAEPRGVVAVIPPWNFPIAIPCGMTCAALVTGNPVLLKPAEQTPRCARALVDVLWSAGVPRRVLQLVPGAGETLGARLVRDPRVAMIAFTGSQEVGLEILRVAGEVGPEQREIKHVVCEMGGKNAILVDATADLDEAVLGVRDSAFGFQGQKCSACSRVVVLDSVYDVFLERLIEATRALVIGDPRHPDTDVGPLIDAAAASKVRDYVEIGQREGRLELACDVPAGLEDAVGKPYVGPHVFSGIERGHRLANEEIFGPVLAVMRAATFEDALVEANATRARLTGGVFSRTPAHLALAREAFRVGDLYLNRGITGARVGRQPFGGLGLSGVGAQAGGPGYLSQFVRTRSICENAMRRGFSPEL